jgi:glycosyl transferase, family 25
MVSTSTIVRYAKSFPKFAHNRVLSLLRTWPYATKLNDDWLDIPVYCVSMKRSIRRRDLIQYQMHSLGFVEFQFVDGQDLRHTELAELEREGLYDSSEAMLHHGRGLRHDQLSCSLAHADAYSRIVRNPREWALVIEDDALFLSFRMNKLNPKHFPMDADVVFLNSFRTTRMPDPPQTDGLYSVDSYTGSTCAYLISRSGAEKLAKHALPVIHAADGFVGRNLEWHPTIPHKFKQRGARTELRGYLAAPDPVVNGSDAYYYRSIHRPS